MDWLIAAGSIAAILAFMAAGTELVLTIRDRRLHCVALIDRASRTEGTLHLDLRNGLRCMVHLLRVRMTSPRGSAFLRGRMLDEEWQPIQKPLAPGALVSLPFQLVGLPPDSFTLVVDLRYERRSRHRRESQITARSKIPESPR